VAKARAVHRNHAIFFSGKINQTAGLKVLEHAPVAVKQDQRDSRPPLDIVETNAVNGDESPQRRITTLSFLCKPMVY
jgi:hypothetical protein